MGTHWLGEDFLSPLPQRINRQRPPVPCRPDFHVGVPFGGILFRDLPKRELLSAAEEYEKLMKRLEADPALLKSGLK